MKTVDKSIKPGPGIVLLMQNLSSSTSTIGMMQEFDETLIKQIELFLQGDQKLNFLSGTNNLDLNIKVRKKYPVLMNILEAIVDPDGTIGKPLRFEFYIKSHCALNHPHSPVPTLPFRIFQPKLSQDHFFVLLCFRISRIILSIFPDFRSVFPNLE